MKFQPTSVFGNVLLILVIIGLCKPLLQTINNLLLWSELFTFSGEELELEKGKLFINFSKRAWEEAGLHAYSKDPRSKWWDGYRAQEHVIIGIVFINVR